MSYLDSDGKVLRCPSCGNDEVQFEGYCKSTFRLDTMGSDVYYTDEETDYEDFYEGEFMCSRCMHSSCEFDDFLASVSYDYTITVEDINGESTVVLTLADYTDKDEALYDAKCIIKDHDNIAWDWSSINVVECEHEW